MNVIQKTISSLFFSILFLPAMASAQTLWTGPENGDWNTATNWDKGVPGPEVTARITAKDENRIQVKAPVAVQGIEINAAGKAVLEGEPITLGAGCAGTFNSLLVNSGDVIVNNKIINTQNKRITLNKDGKSLTMNGGIETGNQTTQIGNLGGGTLTLNGDRSGANSLIIRDGKVVACAILSCTGGGNTQVLENGILISSRKQGPSIQAGSHGLALMKNGTFRLATPNQIASYVNFAGGRLELAGFSNNVPVVGNATLTANSAIDFSNAAAESLAFADLSKNTNWKTGATLQVMGFTKGDTLRFGENAKGLTEAQLAAIQFDGKPAQIDSSGFVTPAP